MMGLFSVCFIAFPLLSLLHTNIITSEQVEVLEGNNTSIKWYFNVTLPPLVTLVQTNSEKNESDQISHTNYTSAVVGGVVGSLVLLVLVSSMIVWIKWDKCGRRVTI